jgi:hypothetical protein
VTLMNKSRFLSPYASSVALACGLSALALGCSGPPESDEPEGCTEAPGVACVWAGTGQAGLNGDGLPRRKTRLYWPIDLDFAPDGTPWVLDWNNHLIRRVLSDDTFETVAGTFVGDGPPDQMDFVEPGADGLTVSLNHPTDFQFDEFGDVFFAAWHNHKIRKIDPATGKVVVWCGRGPGYAGDGGDASEALFNQPKSIAFDGEGALYILDQRNFRIRKIDAEHTITTVVGIGTAGFDGDGGPPSEATLRFEAGPNPEPSGGLVLGPDGALYFSDGLNHRIRRVDFAANTIETIAGTGEPGYSGDGGPAIDAQIDNVRDLEFGPDGRLYFADTENHRIRAIDLGSGLIDTVAGSGAPGEAGDARPALAVDLNRPMGLAFDAEGALYIADTFNNRILKVAQ